ncbi:MAG: hypothetical protein ACOCSF_07580 [Halanaeroarchaeum sp.]
MTPIGSILLGTGVLVLALSAVYRAAHRDYGGTFYLTVVTCCLFAGTLLTL